MFEQPVRLCRDCAHFVPTYQTCALSPMPQDFVNGTPTNFYKAQTERESFSGCGENARWFAPNGAA